MREALFGFKVFEGIFSVICMIIHIYGFLDEFEPFPHQLLFCGTYFAFSLISLFGCVEMILGIDTSMLMEAIVGSVATFLFISASILSMKNAEEDEHLQYLSDIEEFEHPFFNRSKYQSVFSLVTGVFYILHTTFAIDHLIVRDNDNDDRESRISGLTGSVGDQTANEPIRLWRFTHGKCFRDCRERCGYFVSCKWIQRKNGQSVDQNV